MNDDGLVYEAINILTEAAEGDEASDHKRGVQVELLGRAAFSPGVAIAVVEHPEDGERWDADQQDGGERDDERVLAPLARASLILVRLVWTSALAVTNILNISYKLKLT